jgi:hypothetical protein
MASGVTYTAPGATEIKLVDSFVVQSLACTQNWYIPEWIDSDSIDYTWHPNPLDPPCNYHFETKWHWDRVGGPEYQVPSATDVKYLDSIVADTQSDPACWYIPDWIDTDSIDYTWVPCPSDPPYIYEFPVEWGWNNIGGPEYRVPGATEKKYVAEIMARTRPDPDRFEILDNIDSADDVLRWRPNPTEQPYIYVFGNQWHAPEQRASVIYRVPGASEYKYVREIATRRLPDTSLFVKNVNCEFDFSWEPDPGDPPYIYVFGNQWWPAEIMPTVTYAVPSATEHKFLDHPCARLLPTDDHWVTVCEQAFDFDRSWCPDPGDPPYIYVFGNQWHTAEIMPTIEYRVPGAIERKFMDHPRARLHEQRDPWSVPEELDAGNIDYSWCPDPGSPPYIYHFGTDYQDTVGLTYTVPGATELKFAGEVPRVQQEQPVVTVLEIFYMDHSNAASASRFDALQQRYPHVQRVRYVNSTIDTIKRCVARCKGSKFWVVSSRNDYTDFDFAWHAKTWQSSMTHVFGTQWNKWSDTFLINRWEFERHVRWAQGIEEFPNLNFVADQQVLSPSDATDIYVVDHGNPATLDYLSKNYRVVRSVRFFDNYLRTLSRIVSQCESEYVWVTSSLCDYSWFDFSWQPEAWQQDMLHVFPSGDQKFGDTFYVPVRQLRGHVDRLERLEWFDTVNFCEDQTVPRWPMPIIKHDDDSHVTAVQNYDLVDPLAVFTNRSVDAARLPVVSMWEEKSRTIVPLDPGAGAVIVPKSAVPVIRSQLYDYAYINKSHKAWSQDRPIDIVYISNGETNAERNWERLQDLTGGRAKRVDGINGRGAAYRAAADASDTQWFFAVFAKLSVAEDFDWHWLPDRMQQAKHYIFHARNPITGLEYGHMATIAYNCRLVLENTESGLDFTLDQPHEVVPMLSGVAEYNDDAWMTWRTAFREVLKLRHSLPDVENQYRLNRWLSADQGLNGEWSRWGAEDAVSYYESVNGDFNRLKLSYEWAWLRDYAFARRGLEPGQ